MMNDGVDVRYATEELAAGGSAAAATADAAGAVAGHLAEITVDAAAFGRVDQAGPLGTGLTALRDGAAALARGVETAHGDLAKRAATTAGQGEQGVADTTAAANAAPAPAAAGPGP